MTKQGATPPLWLKICMWIPVPVFLFFGGERFVEEDSLLSGCMAFFGLFWFFRNMKSVNEAAIVSVGVRLSVAVMLFVAGSYRELGDYPYAIGFGVVGLLAYFWLFRPDMNRGSYVETEEAANESESSE